VCTTGCGFDPRWPQRGPPAVPDDGAEVALRIDGAVRPNYFQRWRGGRIVEVAFDDDGDGKPDERIDRLGDRPDWPLCVLVLDGVPFTVVSAMWKEGRFRLFPQPSRLITVFPAMTDLAMSRMFETEPCTAPEALYFDSARNRMIGGHKAYLGGANAPWLGPLSYHAPQTIGARAYLDPQAVFDEEMRETLRLFRQTKRGEATAYSIGTAGLGTRGGRPAMRLYLQTVERLFERLVYEKRGRVRLALLADHGHDLLPCRRVGFRDALGRAGLRLTNAIGGPRDVVIPAYGLVTYAAVFTQRPAEAAAALLADPAVELAAYREGQAVIVRARDAEAAIERREGGYTYTARRGDPLRLWPILARMRSSGHGVGPDGSLEDAGLFEATATHDFPDALHRLWHCFDGLMQKPPDLILSLNEGYCHGSWLFEIGVGRVASTHGSLARESSTTFLLSDAGPLPKALRVDEVMRVLRAGRGGARAAVSTNRGLNAPGS